MNKAISVLAFLPFILTSCFTTKVVTVSPGVSEPTKLSSFGNLKTVSQTAAVSAVSEDISLHLDLQAIGAAFAESNTVSEFEDLLNGTDNISNLDLNGDGYVDYLRVMESVDNNDHIFVVQAVLGDNVFQDVATIVVESPRSSNYHVEIIGNPYIYGPSYYVRPVFELRPCILYHLAAYNYRPWHSPWHWKHYPTHYVHHAPIHYRKYWTRMDNYMASHRYCHSCNFPKECHYPRYSSVSAPICRNDYGRQYPERSFTSRNANTPVGNSAVGRAAKASSSRTPYNAQDILDKQGITNTRTARVSTSRSASTTSSASRSAASVSGSRNASTTSTSRSATSTMSGRAAATKNGTTTSSSRSTTSRSATTTSSGRSASSTSSGSRSASSVSTSRSASSTSTGSRTNTRSTKVSDNVKKSSAGGSRRSSSNSSTRSSRSSSAKSGSSNRSSSSSSSSSDDSSSTSSRRSGSRSSR